MTLRNIRVGALDGIQYNDVDFPNGAIETDQPIKAGTPVASNDVLRKADIGGIVGNVNGPGTSTDKAVARFNGAGGKTIQNSLLVVSDAGHVTSFGGNIKFPTVAVPSADANTLDDYRENTWTPVLTFGAGGAVAPTYSTQEGIYTKIGRVVAFTCRLILTNKGDRTGNATIVGLPFTNTAVSFAVSIWLNGVTFANAPFARIVASTAVITLSELTEAGVYSQLTDADFADNSTLIISGIYFV